MNYLQCDVYTSEKKKNHDDTLKNSLLTEFI